MRDPFDNPEVAPAPWKCGGRRVVMNDDPRFLVQKGASPVVVAGRFHFWPRSGAGALASGPIAIGPFVVPAAAAAVSHAMPAHPGARCIVESGGLHV